LEREVDETICLDTPADFRAVGQFYREFRQVQDGEVIELLGQAHKNFTNEQSRSRQ
jgi:predicted phosphoribosyltransferase